MLSVGSFQIGIAHVLFIAIRGYGLWVPQALRGGWDAVVRHLVAGRAGLTGIFDRCCWLGCAAGATRRTCGSRKPSSATPLKQRRRNQTNRDSLRHRVVQAATAMRSRPRDTSTRTTVTPLTNSALLVLVSHGVTATARITNRSTSPAKDDPPVTNQHSMTERASFNRGGETKFTTCDPARGKLSWFRRKRLCCQIEGAAIRGSCRPVWAFPIFHFAVPGSGTN